MLLFHKSTCILARGPVLQRNSLPLEREITLISLRTFRVPSGFWTLGPDVQNGFNYYHSLDVYRQGQICMAGRLVLSLVYRDGQCCSHFRSEGNCGTGNGQSLGLMDSVPGSTTNLLCDPGQVLFPSLRLSFLICKMGRILCMPPICWEYR